MPLKLKSAFMTSTGNDARLLMDCGVGDQIVSVTHEALEAVADPPRADEFRLQEFIETFSQIASLKFDRREFDQTGHVSVMAQDVRSWQALNQ